MQRPLDPLPSPPHSCLLIPQKKMISQQSQSIKPTTDIVPRKSEPSQPTNSVTQSRKTSQPHEQKATVIFQTVLFDRPVYNVNYKDPHRNCIIEISILVICKAKSAFLLYNQTKLQISVQVNRVIICEDDATTNTRLLGPCLLIPPNNSPPMLDQTPTTENLSHRWLPIPTQLPPPQPGKTSQRATVIFQTVSFD